MLCTACLYVHVISLVAKQRSLHTETYSSTATLYICMFCIARGLLKYRKFQSSLICVKVSILVTYYIIWYFALSSLLRIISLYLCFSLFIQPFFSPHLNI